MMDTLDVHFSHYTDLCSSESFSTDVVPHVNGEKRNVTHFFVDIVFSDLFYCCGFGGEESVQYLITSTSIPDTF